MLSRTAKITIIAGCGIVLMLIIKILIIIDLSKDGSKGTEALYGIISSYPEAQHPSSPSSEAEPENIPAQLFGDDDLLDAIKQVESNGDANAVGDYKEIEYVDINTLEVSRYELAFPVSSEFPSSIYRRKNDNPIDMWIAPVSGEFRIYEYTTVGAYQITKVYVDDVNRIIKKLRLDDKPFSYDDRWDRKKSRRMVQIYTLYYGGIADTSDWQMKDLLEARARIHNAGPDGWRNDAGWFVRNRGYNLEAAKEKIANAKRYWLKVKARMEMKRGKSACVKFGVIWPEIFIDENFKYPDDDKKVATAIADGLSGWGICFAGNKPPENFGMGMAKINKITGIATPEGLMKASEALLDNWGDDG